MRSSKRSPPILGIDAEAPLKRAHAPLGFQLDCAILGIDAEAPLKLERRRGLDGGKLRPSSASMPRPR